MGKYLLGVLSGVVLVILLFVGGLVALASFKSKPAAVADGSTLVLRLSGEIPERSPLEIPLPILGDKDTLTVQNIWSVLRRAAKDPKIKAIVLQPEGASLGWAKMQEIRHDLDEFRKSGKPIYAYLRTPTSRDYYLASGASKIYVGPSDGLNVKGVALGLMYYKGTLDKLGVQVEVEHAGKYKDFGDSYTRTSMSAETREVINGIADNVFGDLVAAIARGRNRSEAEIRATIDEGPFLSSQAKAKGLVDEVKYEDEMWSDLKKALKQKEIKKSSAHDYASSPDPDAGSQDKIGFVVAAGAISRGDSDSTDDSGLESGQFVRMIKKVADDSTLKGVIVRIDSPGGEVPASDEMWRAMQELHRKKPVVISMSDAAASGGYYMAMSGDPIVAYPGTETGSIGVVFAKPNLRGLYEKVGLSKDFVSRGKLALMESEDQPMSPAARAKLRDGIDATYVDFVGKVAASRKRPFAEIEPLAQGRVWMGDQAKAKGLVDELGGIDRAVELVRKKAGIPATAKVHLVTFPGKRSLLDMWLHTSASDSGDQDVAARLSGVFSRTGLAPLAAAWADRRLRVWMRGGMLQMAPFSIELR